MLDNQFSADDLDRFREGEWSVWGSHCASPIRVVLTICGGYAII
jgi:hypothetical protein